MKSQNSKPIKKFLSILDQNRLSGPAASSPKASTLRPHSSIANSPSSNRNAAVILEKSTKPLRLTRCTENDNNNSKKLVNKNTNSSQKAQLAQQSTLRTQMIESNLMHANKSAAALGVLVQYLAFNVSIEFSEFYFSWPRDFSILKYHNVSLENCQNISDLCVFVLFLPYPRNRSSISSILSIFNIHYISDLVWKEIFLKKLKFNLWDQVKCA